ncbi:MAG: MarR family winged helix-turn-helix transcriptional regulator [Halomonas sp.]|uniref:MarR family winged helix-turn-helix transcriptional regulator n=1 Tax=Halomonas sp. TaxID=1486246 RepID=UPI003F936103
MPFKKTYNFHLHLHFAHLLEEHLRNRLAPLGVHPRQARILGILGMMGQASQAQLAREAGLTAASMSTMTSRLLAAGLIERHVDAQEHRRNVLTLTQRGTNLLKQIHQEWQTIDRETIEVIGEENTAIYAALSLRLRNALGGSTPCEEYLDKDTVASPSPGEKM